MDTCIQQRVGCLINNEDVDFAVFPAVLFNSSGFIPKSIVGVGKRNDILLSLLRVEYPLLVWTNIYRRHQLIKKGISWDENLTFLQDFDFNFQVLSMEMKYFYPDNICVDYFVRSHTDSRITSNRNTRIQLNSIIYLIKKILNWILSENNTGKYKKNNLYGLVLFGYSLIKQDKDLSAEYIEFCKKNLSTSFYYRLKLTKIVKKNLFFPILALSHQKALFIKRVKYRKIMEIGCEIPHKSYNKA
jgi:hypothetical protein